MPTHPDSSRTRSPALATVRSGGRTWWRLGLVAASLMLLVTLAYCAIPVILFSRGIGEDRSLGRGAITDEECIELFRGHARDCEDLRRVALGDTTRRRRYDDLPADPTSVAERQRLLDRIGAYDVRTPRLVSGEGIDCEIQVGYWGNFFRARHMSFVFAPSGTAPPANERRHEWFRPLGGGWFLRYRLY